MPKYLNKLIVNLSKIRENYNFLCSLTNAEVGAVVKTDAYGLGIEKVTDILIKSGCRSFFVNDLEEAFKIKHFIPIGAKIYALHGLVFSDEAIEFYTHDIIPVLNNISQVNIWQNFASSKNMVLPYTLYVDTGMNRLGVSQNELNNILNNSSTLTANLKLNLLISHLACADDPQSPHNTKQLLRLKEIIKIFPNVKVSFANSAGVFLGKDYHFDLIRPGAALYGLQPTNTTYENIQNVVKYVSQIIQINNVPEGEVIGYGATYRTNTKTQIAVIPLGYADKYSTNFSNKGNVVISGYIAPVVGRVSMNLMTIDVTNIPENLIYIGQEVEIISDLLNPNKLSILNNSLHYEILTAFVYNGIRREYICFT